MPTQEFKDKDDVYQDKFFTWDKYVVKGKLEKEAPSIDNELKFLGYVLRAPLSGTRHSISTARPSFLSEREKDFSVLKDISGAYTWKTPAPPIGDWKKGSQYKNILWNNGNQYTIITEFVSLNEAVSTNERFLDQAIFKIGMVWLNAVTLGLFYDNMGGWIIKSVTKEPIPMAKKESDSKSDTDFSGLEYSSKKATPNFLYFALLGAGAILKAPVLMGAGAVLYLAKNAKKKEQKPKFQLGSKFGKK